MAPDQNRAFGIVLIGASRFPHMVGLDNPAFAESKSQIADVLSKKHLIADRISVLDLFDKELTAIDIVDRVYNFLDQDRDLTDLIIYYCGHGAFLSDRSYYLTLKSTRQGREATTGLLFRQFRLDLDDLLHHKRTYLFLDCCYAAAAVSDWMSSSSIANVIADQIEAAFPTGGTALFVAASKSSPAIAPSGQKTTLFSGHLADVIRDGVKNERRLLSLADIAEAVRTRIRHEPLSRNILPEIHVPRQNSGDVSILPLIKNYGIFHQRATNTRLNVDGESTANHFRPTSDEKGTDTGAKPQPLLRVEPMLAAILLGLLAIPAAFLSALSPWIFVNPNIPFGYGMVWANLTGGPQAVPLLPSVWFAVVLCIGVYLWETKNILKITFIFLAVLVGWILAWEVANVTMDELSGLNTISTPAGGLFGGFAITSVIALSLWICSKDFRSTPAIAVTVLVGTIAGSSLFFGPNLITLYLLWEPAVAGVIAYFLVQPKSRQSGGNPFIVISRKQILPLIGCFTAIIFGFFILKQKERETLNAQTKENEVQQKAADERQYELAAGDVEKLRDYINYCGVCTFRNEAVQKIIELKTKPK